MQPTEQGHLYQTFGSPDRYYAQGLLPVLYDFSPATQKMILGLPPEHKQEVERTHSEWNAAIRENIRRETGLSISSRNTRQAVSIRVLDGLPVPLAQALDNVQQIELWPLPLYRSTFEQTSNGISLLAEYLSAIELYGLSSTNIDKLTTVQMTVQALLEQLAEMDIIQKILRIDEDVLGSYFFYRSEIHLYWMAISLVSAILDVPPSDLTLVVLTHELAHAYTHLGLDIDGKNWETDAFSSTETSLIEGLAQFYTQQVGIRLRERVPGMEIAFEKLLAKQSPTYTEFKIWGKPTDPHLGEVVRFSLIACRLNQMKRHADFVHLLADNQERVASSRSSRRA